MRENSRKQRKLRMKNKAIYVFYVLRYIYFLALSFQETIRHKPIDAYSAENTVLTVSKVLLIIVNTYVEALFFYCLYIFLKMRISKILSITLKQQILIFIILNVAIMEYFVINGMVVIGSLVKYLSSDEHLTLVLTNAYEITEQVI